MKKCSFGDCPKPATHLHRERPCCQLHFDAAVEVTRRERWKAARYRNHLARKGGRR